MSNQVEEAVLQPQRTVSQDGKTEFYDHHPVDHEPTSNTLRPREDSLLTIRLIKFVERATPTGTLLKALLAKIDRSNIGRLKTSFCPILTSLRTHCSLSHGYIIFLTPACSMTVGGLKSTIEAG